MSKMTSLDAKYSPSGNIPECWQAKGNFRCYGNAKWMNIILQVSRNSTEMYTITLPYCIASILSFPTSSLHISDFAVHVGHTANHPTAKVCSLSSFIIIWIDSGEIKTAQSKCNLLSYRRVSSGFNFWKFTLILLPFPSFTSSACQKYIKSPTWNV